MVDRHIYRDGLLGFTMDRRGNTMDTMRGIRGLKSFDADAAGYRLRRYSPANTPVWNSRRGCWVGYTEYYVEVKIGEEVVYNGPSINDWPRLVLEHARASGAVSRYEQAQCAESPLFAARYALTEAEDRLREFLDKPLSTELPPDQRPTADVAVHRMLSDPMGDAVFAALRCREDKFKSDVARCREHLASVEASLTVGGLLSAAREMPLTTA